MMMIIIIIILKKKTKENHKRNNPMLFDYLFWWEKIHSYHSGLFSNLIVKLDLNKEEDKRNA